MMIAGRSPNEWHIDIGQNADGTCDLLYQEVFYGPDIDEAFFERNMKAMNSLNASICLIHSGLEISVEHPENTNDITLQARGPLETIASMISFEFFNHTPIGNMTLKNIIVNIAAGQVYEPIEQKIPQEGNGENLKGGNDAEKEI